jgi:adenylate cyclase
VLLVLSAAIVLVGWLALRNGFFLPVFGPLASAGLSTFRRARSPISRERTQRLRTSGMFKRFLDPRVVTDLIERGEIDHRSSAESREVTVLFSDIRGFTALSEASLPKTSSPCSTAISRRQVEVIFRNGGHARQVHG